MAIGEMLSLPGGWKADVAYGLNTNVRVAMSPQHPDGKKLNTLLQADNAADIIERMRRKHVTALVCNTDDKTAGSIPDSSGGDGDFVYWSDISNVIGEPRNPEARTQVASMHTMVEVCRTDEVLDATEEFLPKLTNNGINTAENARQAIAYFRDSPADTPATQQDFDAAFAILAVSKGQGGIVDGAFHDMQQLAHVIKEQTHKLAGLYEMKLSEQPGILAAIPNQHNVHGGSYHALHSDNDANRELLLYLYQPHRKGARLHRGGVQKQGDVWQSVNAREDETATLDFSKPFEA